ncbi:MAG: hypothetical protein ACPLZG_11000, partial [Thermoproteota archaeon]
VIVLYIVPSLLSLFSKSSEKKRVPSVKFEVKSARRKNENFDAFEEVKKYLSLPLMLSTNPFFFLSFAIFLVTVFFGFGSLPINELNYAKSGPADLLYQTIMNELRHNLILSFDIFGSVLMVFLLFMVSFGDYLFYRRGRL